MPSDSQLPPLVPRAVRPFRCETLPQHDSARVLAIGELDLDTVPLLDAELDAQRKAGFRHLILDLSGLEFIDSTGLRCILDWNAEARRDGFTLALIPGPQAVQRVFELTRTREHLPFSAPDPRSA